MTDATHRNQPTVLVIGSGPAGLMASEILSQNGLQVEVYDAMPSAGRKLLMAGKGGLNISHSEPFDQFLSRYGTRQNYLKPILEGFGPEALRNWVRGLGIDTFIGTSGRIFPAEMKAAPLLRAWLRRLRQQGVNFHMKHEWTGWCGNNNDKLRFVTPHGEQQIQAGTALVLALGGASWPKLGSTGAWLPLLRQQGIPVQPLQPANCGFDVNWSAHFRHRFAGAPLKPVAISFTAHDGIESCRKGEVIVTENGLEGGAIYALSSLIRDTIIREGQAIICIDLAPDRTLQALIDNISVPRGKDSLANHLRKRIGLAGIKAGLLWEIVAKADVEDPDRLASLIKALPVRLIATRPIAEAISSAGGVMFEGLDERLMLRSLPGVFCAGEMLDWEAPTGGYLLTACFASGYAAGRGVLSWLGRKISIRNEQEKIQPLG